MLLEREGQLDVLAELTRQAADGRGSTVVVCGEAGIGKTSLLQAYAAAHEGGCRLAWGWCEPLATPRPLGPLQDCAPRLDAQLAAMLQEAPLAQICAHLLALLQQAPATTVLVFEDMHWADAATLDLVRYLSRLLLALPALLVLSLRRDELGEAHPLRHLGGDLDARSLTRIELAPLSAAAVAQLATAAGRSVEGLHALTAGNPFYLGELLAQSECAGPALPVSVRDAVLARLQRLQPAERSVLDLLSVVPGSIEAALWQSLTPAQIAAVAQCRERGILRADDAEALVFHHELVRRAVLDDLDAARRRQCHAQILALLRAPAGRGASLARLVHHAAAAGDGTCVLELAPRAAAEAARLGAHRQAAQQLQTALDYVRYATVEQAAQLHEDWAYEAGLAVRIDDTVIAARQHAIALWQRLGRTEKVGHNLRWLSRLHWYRGEPEQAEAYANAAVQELEAAPPGHELAMAYSMRAQLHMLHDRFEQAIAWGERALALAERLDDAEVRIHALNNIGSARLFGADDLRGVQSLEESLRLALELNYDEHAARAYTNLGEWALLTRRFAVAERVLGDGLMFMRSHDLDAWVQYLQGLQAQLRMYQGRLGEADAIARRVLQAQDRSVIERMPALVVGARVALRMGDAQATALLQTALQRAQSVGEVQYIMPVRLGLVEAAWLQADQAAMHAQLAALAALPDASPDLWECGEMAVWRRRAGLAPLPAAAACTAASPWAAELDGDAAASARLWQALGAPVEAALALMQVTGDAAAAALAQAVRITEKIGAQALVRRARMLAVQRGVSGALPRACRGPYGVARVHPLGLTRREQQILQLLAAGQGSTVIAQRLSRSPRTVEHHIAGVYAKLGIGNRVELLLRLRDEPWLLQPEGSPQRLEA